MRMVFYIRCMCVSVCVLCVLVHVQCIFELAAKCFVYVIWYNFNVVVALVREKEENCARWEINRNNTTIDCLCQSLLTVIVSNVYLLAVKLYAPHCRHTTVMHIMRPMFYNEMKTNTHTHTHTLGARKYRKMPATLNLGNKIEKKLLMLSFLPPSIPLLPSIYCTFHCDQTKYALPFADCNLHQHKERKIRNISTMQSRLLRICLTTNFIQFNSRCFVACTLMKTRAFPFLQFIFAI